MSYKNLLVYLDETEASKSRAALALKLAEEHGAHLTALGLVVEPVIPSFVYAQVPAEVLEARRGAVREQIRTVLDRFEAAAQRSSVETSVRMDDCLQSDVSRTVGLHARYSDLLILGQSNPEETPLGGGHLAEEVVLAAGRPLLIVPYIGADKTLGETVVVAWDASREAARAVSDSLPILEQAKQVVVIAVNPRGSADGHGQEPGADLALHLTRHGCSVQVERLESHEIGIGDTLLSFLADRSADLLVMGGYGHARIKELVLGGVTQHMMAHMTVPVLMSH